MTRALIALLALATSAVLVSASATALAWTPEGLTPETERGEPDTPLADAGEARLFTLSEFTFLVERLGQTAPDTLYQLELLTTPANAFGR